MSGNYITNLANKVEVKVDFYLVKGIIENLLKYLGFKNRYSFERIEIKELHPGISANIIIDKKAVGIIGRVHPSKLKDEVYVCELSLTDLYDFKIKPLKFKEASKYPGINKDMAFIVDNDIMVIDIINTIKKAGGRLLTDVSVFDVYFGNNIKNNKKSIAFSLTFEDSNRTLTDEEVNIAFNKIIDEVKDKYNAILRDN